MGKSKKKKTWNIALRHSKNKVECNVLIIIIFESFIDLSIKLPRLKIVFSGKIIPFIFFIIKNIR